MTHHQDDSDLRVEARGRGRELPEAGAVGASEAELVGATVVVELGVARTSFAELISILLISILKKRLMVDGY